MEIKSKGSAIWGIVLMILAITGGAMGAHALEKVLTEQLLESYQTGVDYMLYMGLSLLLLSLWPKELAKVGAVLIKAGVVLFSGSIFGLVFLKNGGGDAPIPLVIATPVGGTLMIAGWIVLLLKVALRK